MRIALVRRQFTFRKGGAEGYAVLVARELLKRGWRVSVVAETADTEGLPAGLSVHRVRTVPVKTFARHLLFVHAARRALNAIRPDRVLAFCRLDRAHILRSGDPLFIHWLRRHKPNVADKLLGWLNPKQRSLLQLEERVFRGRYIRRIIALSHMDAALMRRYYGVAPSKIVVLHNGYDPQRFNPDLRRHRQAIRREWGISSRPLILFVGMDFKRKGLDVALSAMRKVEEGVLVVVGGGDIVGFSALARRLGVANRVVFVGRRDDVERFYGAADVFLLPSRYDPFGNAVLEAMASALPVVVTEDTGSAEIVRPDCGVVLPSDADGEAVAAAVLRLLNRKERFGEAAYRVAAHYTISKYAQKLTQLLLQT